MDVGSGDDGEVVYGGEVVGGAGHITRRTSHGAHEWGSWGGVGRVGWVWGVAPLGLCVLWGHG